MIRTSAKLLAATACAALLAGCTMVTDMMGSTVTPHSETAAALGMPTASPESQGFSTAGLDQLTSEFRALVDQKKLAGVTTLVSRHGQGRSLRHLRRGRTRRRAKPLKPDSIFRIASMTKPIAGVAMMQLWEQGKWKLDDPVSKHIPGVRRPQGEGPEQHPG
jgi:CubicO group peptidase (beta-lactamase class C family)